MTRNVCGIDRMIRILLGLALAGALGLGLVPDGIASIIAGIVALVIWQRHCSASVRPIG